MVHGMKYTRWSDLTRHLNSNYLSTLSFNRNVEELVSQTFTKIKGIEITNNMITTILKSPNMLILKNTEVSNEVMKLSFENIYNQLLLNMLEEETLIFANSQFNDWLITSLKYKDINTSASNLISNSIYGYITSLNTRSEVFTISKLEASRYSIFEVMNKLKTLFLKDENTIFMEPKYIYYNKDISTKIFDFLTENNIVWNLEHNVEEELLNNVKYINKSKLIK